jgi:hypothetical protein
MLEIESLLISMPTSSVLGRGFGGSKPPPPLRSFDKAEPNSQFHGKYIHNNLIRIRVSLFCKLSGTPDYGFKPPYPRSLYPLFSTEFVEKTPLIKISGYATDANCSIPAPLLQLNTFMFNKHTCFLQTVFPTSM